MSPSDPHRQFPVQFQHIQDPLHLPRRGAQRQAASRIPGRFSRYGEHPDPAGVDERDGGHVQDQGGPPAVDRGLKEKRDGIPGGDVNLAGGAKDGTGVVGVVRVGGVQFVSQGAPAAATTSATLTAANLLAKIITVNQGASGASAQQLPLATDLDTALPSSVAGDAFDFSVINISVTAAEAASITTNTGWTLVGDMDIAANSAITTKSAGRFRARKTGAGAWTLYRLS